VAGKQWQSLKREPIGVFDSGLGGLSVVANLMRVLPDEEVLFFGDTAHVPYGERPLCEIREFALDITRYLVGHGAKMIVMACNMSSATALDNARREFPDLPVLGVIAPGARAVMEAIRSGMPPRIGVLATTGTVRSGAYSRIIRELAPDATVFEQACPRFVPLIEAGEADSAEARCAAEQYAARLVEQDVSAVILGCTHYPYVKRAIAAAMGRSVTIVDPAEETALEAARMLRERGLLGQTGSPPMHSFIVSGPSRGDARFVEIGSRFLGRRIETLQHAAWGVDVGKVFV